MPFIVEPCHGMALRVFDNISNHLCMTSIYNNIMKNEQSIAFLPLDNRPISYLLPKQIADFSGIDLIMPDKKYLGDLKTGSDLEYIEKWCRGLINQTPTLVISLDNWVYGGLVQSRKHSCALDELRNRINKLTSFYDQDYFS